MSYSAKESGPPGAVHLLQTEPGDGGIGERLVHGLPATVAAAISSTASTLSSLLAAAATAANQATANTSLASILSGMATAAAQSAGNTTLSSILTALGAALTVNLPSGASTAGNQTSANTKLDTLHTDLGTTIHADLATTLAGKLDTLHTDAGTTLHADINPASGGTPFQQTIGASATQLTGAVVTNGIWVQNISISGQVGYVGKSSVTTTGGTGGYFLAPGQERWFPCRNANEWYGIFSAAGGVICVEPV